MHASAQSGNKSPACTSCCPIGGPHAAPQSPLAGCLPPSGLGFTNLESCVVNQYDQATKDGETTLPPQATLGKPWHRHPASWRCPGTDGRPVLVRWPSAWRPWPCPGPLESTTAPLLEVHNPAPLARRAIRGLTSVRLPSRRWRLGSCHASPPSSPLLAPLLSLVSAHVHSMAGKVLGDG